MVKPSCRRKMAQHAVASRVISIRLACSSFNISETCYRYQAKLKDENEIIAHRLIELTEQHTDWGFGLCFDHLHHIEQEPWNHKRVYRIYCELALNLRIRPRRRLKRHAPEPLKEPIRPNQVWSLDFMHDQLSDGQSYMTFGLTIFSLANHNKMRISSVIIARCVIVGSASICLIRWNRCKTMRQSGYGSITMNDHTKPMEANHL